MKFMWEIYNVESPCFGQGFSYHFFFCEREIFFSLKYFLSHYFDELQNVCVPQHKTCFFT